MSAKVEVELLCRLEAMAVERDRKRDELERLRRLVPTGTYTLNVAHEEEIQRLKDAGEVLVRSLELMTKERDEALADIETLKLHVEMLREAWRSASDEVKRNALCLRAATLGEAMTQWYSIDPEHNVEIWATEAEAKAAAESALEHYRDNASDVWHEQMEALEWGMLVTHGHAKEVDRVEREDDDTGRCERLGVDYRCDYVLEDCARKTNNETKKENDNGN